MSLAWTWNEFLTVTGFLLFFDTRPCLWSTPSKNARPPIAAPESAQSPVASPECLSVNSYLCRGECFGGLRFDVQHKDLGLSQAYLLLHVDDNLFDLVGCQMRLELYAQ